MPELPEAESIARALDAKLAGATVTGVCVHRSEVVEPMRASVFGQRLRGRTVESVGRRGKWITAELDDGSRWVTQLRMTGRFAWAPPGHLSSKPHLSLSLRVAGPNASGIVRFFDVRRFARTRIVTPEEWADIDSSLGVEPLSESFTVEGLAELFQGTRAPVRNALLDQARIAGIGNIYANEACYYAGIHPGRPGGDLSEGELKRLHAAVRDVLDRAIRSQGTTFRDYRGIAGDQGSFQNELAVYGRAGERCPRCEAEIERSVMAGRSAFYCPGCQRS